MKFQKFSLSCILISIAIAIEVVVATTGEILVLFTVLSSAPIYIVSRIKPLYGILGYLSVSIFLFIINPHQLFFFMLSNGLIGLSLGICDYKVNNSLISIALCSILLTISVNLICIFIGINTRWFIVLIFSIIYSIACRFLTRKLYILFIKYNPQIWR